MSTLHYQHAYSSLFQASLSYFSGIIGIFTQCFFVAEITYMLRTGHGALYYMQCCCKENRFNNTIDASTCSNVSSSASSRSSLSSRRSSEHNSINKTIIKLVTIFFITTLVYCIPGTIVRTMWLVFDIPVSCMLAEYVFTIPVIISRIILHIIFYLRFKLAFRRCPEFAQWSKVSKCVIILYAPVSICVLVYYVYYESNLFGHSFQHTKCNVSSSEHMTALFPSIISVVMYDIFLVGLFVDRLFKVAQQFATTNKYKVKWMRNQRTCNSCNHRISIFMLCMYVCGCF